MHFNHAQDGVDHISPVDVVQARGGERAKDAAWTHKEVQRDKLVRNSVPSEHRTRYRASHSLYDIQAHIHPGKKYVHDLGALDIAFSCNCDGLDDFAAFDSHLHLLNWLTFSEC